MMNLILVKREGVGMQWGNTVYPEESGWSRWREGGKI